MTDTGKSSRMENRVFVERWAGLLVLGLALVGCTPTREALPVTPPGEAAGAAVTRRPLPEAPAPATSSAPVDAIAPSAPPAIVAPVVVPDNAIYVCVSETGGLRQQTAIEFTPKVAAMCAKHPEMGPCQYERDICRRSGGRVYAAGGIEITAATEAEYDRKVLRVRFKAN
jgi:hypothetical protein